LEVLEWRIHNPDAQQKWIKPTTNANIV
jgi:hypothetical protein